MKKLILIIVIANIKILGQACCTAGTPLLGSLEMSASEVGIFNIGLSYEINSLKDVYSRDIPLEDNTRERTSTSYLLEGDIGISKFFSVSFLISNITQERIIRPISGFKNTVETNGFGDAVFLVKYKFLQPTIVNNQSLSLGVGIKYPVGSYDISLNNILLPADMQPGSGSLDYIIWTQYTKGFNNLSPFSLIFNLSYKLNGSNNRFGNGNDEYAFGNIIQISSGIGYRTDYKVDLSLMLKYRNSGNDKFNNVKIDNTGGNWLYIIPGMNFKILNNFTSRISSELPLYRNIRGTQLTTSYKVKFSFYYSLRI